MRHHSKTKKLSRVRKVRIGLMRSLQIALIEKGRITTTHTRAKALRPSIEKLVTRARGADVATRRVLVARLGNNTKVVKKLIDDIAPKYAKRTGGYTRIVKMPQRKGDAAPMAIIEFV